MIVLFLSTSNNVYFHESFLAFTNAQGSLLFHLIQTRSDHNMHASGGLPKTSFTGDKCAKFTSFSFLKQETWFLKTNSIILLASKLYTPLGLQHRISSSFF